MYEVAMLPKKMAAHANGTFEEKRLIEDQGDYA
jgi:hypothetical protein